MANPDVRSRKDPAIGRLVAKLWKFHEKNRRDLPWRNTRDPYRILLSEMMLQQTQVPRVLQKYDEFLINFPNLESVAAASMTDVLRVWKGLGYNRRAYFIKRIAAELCGADARASAGKKSKPRHKCRPFPSSYEDLIKLPGIGQSTGGAMVAFCFADTTGEKTPFIETNIRFVFMRELFAEKSEEKIKDADILEKLRQCLERIDPKDVREFYYAIYDYGTSLKASLGSKKTAIHRQSAHYSRQSAFKGSVREMRSLILSVLLRGGMSRDELRASLDADGRLKTEESKQRFDAALERLQKDGSIAMSKSRKRDIMEIC